jgi:hypothetical protein
VCGQRIEQFIRVNDALHVRGQGGAAVCQQARVGSKRSALRFTRSLRLFNEREAYGRVEVGMVFLCRVEDVAG